MFVSVIMIVHNRENFVRNMIEDVLGQSFTNYEFIVIDNCSSDSSGDIIEGYRKRDERIIVKHINREVSIGTARNIGIRASRGDYITFVDDDDRISGEYLQYLVDLTHNGRFDISITNSEENSEGIKKPFVEIGDDTIMSGEEAVYELLQRRMIRSGIPAKLIRRKLLLKSPIREDVLHEDVHVMYKYLAAANGVSIGKEINYTYNRHDNNVSSFLTKSKGFNRNDIYEYLEAYKTRRAFLERAFPDMKEYLVYNVGSFMISMLDKIVSNQIDGCEEIADEMRRFIFDDAYKEIIMKYITEDERIKYNSIMRIG